MHKNHDDCQLIQELIRPFNYDSLYVNIYQRRKLFSSQKAIQESHDLYIWFPGYLSNKTGAWRTLLKYRVVVNSSSFSTNEISERHVYCKWILARAQTIKGEGVMWGGGGGGGVEQRGESREGSRQVGGGWVRV